MANQELALLAEHRMPGVGVFDAIVSITWHERTAMYSVDGWRLRRSTAAPAAVIRGDEWQPAYPTAEHMVYALDQSGLVIAADDNYDVLFELDEEVSRKVGDALLVTDGSTRHIGLVTPRGEVVQAVPLRGDGYLPAGDIATMVAPATFSAHDVERQVDSDVVASDMARIVSSMIKQAPMNVRALQVWGMAKLGGDSPVAQYALEESMRVEPSRASAATSAINSHSGISASAVPKSRPSLRRQPGQALRVSPIA